MLNSSLVQSAIAIATQDLGWCYREQGIISGSRLVYWSWDSFFAGMGAVRLGDTEIVRTNLTLYLNLQRADGAIPKRVANPLYWMHYLRLPISEEASHQRPTFWNSYYTAPSIAQNPILLLAFYDYVQQTGDLELAAEYLPRLSHVATYLATQEDGDGLLKEGLGGGWAESILKRGAISFTNMCYARGLSSLAILCRELGEGDLSTTYLEKYFTTREKINRRLWSDEDGGYYSDWLGHRRHHHFATDGNLLAIIWDIATEEQAGRIQEKIDVLSLEDSIPVRLAYGKYDFWRIALYHHLGGMKDYHAGFSWTWLGCIDVIAKLKMGRKVQAELILEKIARVIVRDKTVHETYDREGKAVHTFFYKSEHPWGWGAGMFLYACHEAGYELKGPWKS